LSKDRALQQSWQSYHLIRDTLRGDIGQVMHFDIADRVAAALEKEPARQLLAQENNVWLAVQFYAWRRIWGEFTSDERAVNGSSSG